ncbi:hypothetical protein A3G69_04260 [Candidatus Peribacteria bacterium RIFCSPLOWO2_12_FULL_53_10]|nr:MAG: hypothetical protein A3G69_04260 [Candidatus Peribacteria bacterium RIFCSPLOWO2_12_FULL_53_10]
MPFFSYRATDSTGALQQGNIEAVHADAAREALSQKGWTPIDITAVSSEPFSFVTPQPSQPAQPFAKKEEAMPSPPPSQKISPPIAATLRLYAGWLLAYYALVYAVGWYAHSRPLPFEIPYVEALLLSPLVLSFTFAAFLFLIGHSLYRAWGSGLWKGILVSVIGVGVFVMYRMNVV